MSIRHGQKPFFDYTQHYWNRHLIKGDIPSVDGYLIPKKIQYGSILNKTAGNSYVSSARYDRRYIFNCVNNSFVLDKIQQGPRKKQRLDPNDYTISNPIWRESAVYIHKPQSLIDVNNLNERMNYIDDTALVEDLPSPITDQFLKKIFSNFNTNFKYFLDCTVSKRNILGSSYPNYNRGAFSISQYALSIKRYGILDSITYEALLIRERRQSSAHKWGFVNNEI